MEPARECACGSPRRPRQRTCRACHAAYQRAYRRENPLSPEQAIAARARSYANTYLRRGKLERKGCAMCGAPAQMHHDDYSKPLQVTWLCERHHRRLHTIVGDV